MADLRDLIYLDVPKASSLLSQAESGLLQEIRESEEGSSDAKGTVGAGVSFLKAEVAGTLSERGSRSETRVLHHALLTRLEEVLRGRAMLQDVTAAAGTGNTAEALRDRVTSHPYVRARGWVVFEDYARMKSRMEQFNTLAAFLRKCSQMTLEKTDEYRTVKGQIAAQKQTAEQERDRERRRDALKEVQHAEAGLDQLVSHFVGANAPSPLDDWLVKGVGHWIDTFHPDQIHLRLYPHPDVPGFHLLANLKRSGFLDDSVDNVLFAYGSRPNVQLSMLGLVTSAPRPDGPAFDPMAEYAAPTEPDAVGDIRGFEQGFRQAFVGLQGLETFARFERFPNVTVYPIAVFRDVAG